MNLHSSLRFGNIVKSKSGIYLVVTEIMASGITYDRLDGTAVVRHAEWGEIEPVTLTPEWLGKYGLVKNEYGYYPIGEQFVLRENILKDESGKVEGYILQGKGWHGLVTKPHIKYLHQLQNLFYDLTGTELKITL